MTQLLGLQCLLCGYGSVPQRLEYDLALPVEYGMQLAKLESCQSHDVSTAKSGAFDEIEQARDDWN